MPHINRQKLQDLRKMYGYSLSDLTKLTGISAGTLSHYENAPRNIRLDQLGKIADAFDISVSELLDEHTTAEELFNIGKRNSNVFKETPPLFTAEVKKNENLLFSPLDKTPGVTPLVLASQLLVEADHLFSLPGYTSEDKEALLEAMRQIFAQ